MPEFASNWIRITTIYPGAPAEDVELFVTKPMEEELKGVVGLEEIISTSSVGISSFRIIIDDYYPNKDEVVQEVKDAVLRVDLPSEVRDLPNIRQFKSSEKAILDIGLYHKEHQFLDQKAREELQKYVLSFENSLLTLREISSIDRSHYLKPELQVLIDPNDRERVQISLTEIKDQIQANNVRVPVGSMQDRGESKITALNEYETVESFDKLFLRGNYEGFGVRLSDIAQVQKGFEKSTSIFKINGHEGVFLNIKKSVSTDILTAQEKVIKFIEDFKRDNKDSPVGIVLMDDESYAVTNRLNIISSNGLLGFILIVIVLFYFLDAKSGFWVAMGIPFSMAFTLIISHLAGYTVNNMTLAGIIIVLGIVVDDAIIIAENIARKREEGLSLKEAAVTGAAEVFKPIFASITTTCVTFVPLLFFEGFFGKLVAYIPLVVCLMLLGSLIESLFILPSHLSEKLPFIKVKTSLKDKEHWFKKYEKRYENFLLKIFKNTKIVFASFIAILLIAGAIFQFKMKYEMFPREESQEVVIKVKAEPGTVREETAKLIYPIEEMAVQDKDNVVGVRSSIALSRRGGEVKENEASILIELYPADERDIPLNKLIDGWEEKTKNLPGLTEVKFLRSRWGSDSGSPIELLISENNDEKRAAVATRIVEKLKVHPDLSNAEIEEPLVKKEYLFKLNQENLIRLNVDPARVTTALRTFVEGSILYSINKNDEEVDVRLSVPEKYKKDLSKLLELRVENKNGDLVYLNKMVEIEEVQRPVNINRNNFKRSTMIFADIKEESNKTPLEIADFLEEKIFPEITNEFPGVILTFKGEIEDSRKSQDEFLQSIIMVIVAIYLILVLMFNSITKPFLILSIVPFGLAGVVMVLTLHGMSVYGFFAVIGALGMIGVVINDAIVMIDKVESDLAKKPHDYQKLIAKTASTRLRPILVTTITTVVGILPTAYGLAGYDSMLAEMMLTMGWGLAFGTLITLVLIPCLYTVFTRKFLEVE